MLEAGWSYNTFISLKDKGRTETSTELNQARI